MDPKRYKAVVVFNRPCDAERAVAQRGIGTFIIPHGGGNLWKRIWEYGTLPIKLWLLTRRIKPSLIHADNVMAGRPAVVLGFMTGLPVIVHIRNIGLFTRTAFFVFRANHFAAVSKATIEGTLPRRLHTKATVVWDGLELSDYRCDDPRLKESARKSLMLPQDKIIIGMAARLSQQKGQRYYIEAAKAVTASRADVLFIHAGKKPQSDSADAYERELALITTEMCATGRFAWFDYIEPVTSFWAAVDMAVLPACGPESFSRVTIEAMAMGKPVIATRVGGPEEIIEEDVSGILVQPCNSRALTDAINSLLNDKNKAQRMGQAGRQRVTACFSAERYAERIMQIYHHLINNKKSDLPLKV